MDDVSLVMSPESVNVVVGASGSGKSTLLMCLAGLEVPTKGRVVHGDVDVYGLDDRQRAAWRLRTIGLVFQNSELVPELTLRDNIALPLELLGTGRRDALSAPTALPRFLTSVRAVSDGLAKCQEPGTACCRGACPRAPSDGRSGR
ncbi:ABC transporter [Cutibacterium acnes JCM 18920]|nr:ABC transporter [Cutibacterium acnes JCM 18920]